MHAHDNRPRPCGTLITILAAMLLVLAPGASPSLAAELTPDIPAWLKRHIGTGDGQIAPVVLERARALYRRKLEDRTVRNPCYMAMDATRPSAEGNGRPARRYYIVCEAEKSFRAVSSGYGMGRKLQAANFRNGRVCAKHFSNAEGSNLTAGGVYVTAEPRTSFKGYYRRSGKRMPFLRTFLLFDGEGDTDNARERAIGGHQAVTLRRQCRYKDADSAYADADGFVPYGKLVNYTAGRSNGCTTWSPAASETILALVEDNPTTLYIYPEASDIDAVAAAVKARTSLRKAGLYWDATCLRSIGAPKFWRKQTLRPIIDTWRDGLPEYKPRPLPICR